VSQRRCTAGLALAASLVACGGKASDPGRGYPRGAMDFVAPSGAGGGWDLTIRTVARVLKDTDLVSRPMPVRNHPGAGGSVHLARLQDRRGNDSTITVYSPPLLLTYLNGTTDFSYRDTTPLACLIADYAVFVVSADSPYRTLADVIDSLRKDIKSVKVGGNSSAGSMDHLQFLLVARAAGIKNIQGIDYVSFDDSGAAMVLGGHIGLFSTSRSEFQSLIQSGDLRAPAQTADHRVGEGAAAAIPTCIEQGVDATFVNWRGLFGPPEMPGCAVDYRQDVLGRMVETPEWADACLTNLRDRSYLDAPRFSEFLDRVSHEYAGVLADIGMLRK